MTTRIRSFVVLVTAVLLQATIFSEFRLFGASVEVLLLVTILASYHGAQIFEAIGLGADVIDIAFSGTTSRVAGMTLAELANETLSLHAKALSLIHI